MKVFIILIIILLPFSIDGSSSGSISCKQSEKCFCFTRDSDILEFQCSPENFEKQGITIHVERKEIMLECFNISILNPKILPNLGNNNIDYVEMKFCPFPQHNFNEILKNMINLTQVIVLKFRFSYSTEIYLTRKYFAQFSNLKQLDISANNLSNISKNVFNSLGNLNYINLSQNKLKLIKKKLFENTTSLQILNLAQNQLDTLPDYVFNNLKDLKSLELWQNQLSQLTINHFKGLRELIMLDIQKNNLNRIHPEVFSDLIQLKKLNLAFNLFYTLPYNLFENNINLELLKLGNNPLFTIPSGIFDNLIKLTILELNNCNLHSISMNLFVRLQNLKVLKLNGNQLENIEAFPELSNLEVLNLQNNLIKIINRDTFKNLINLTNIDLSRNHISTINIFSFHLNKNLIDINLSNNNYSMEDDFQSTPFNSCINLKRLDLSHNNITNVDISMVVNFLHLSYLNLSCNRLVTVSLDFLSTFSHNEIYFDLSNNQIQNITIIEDIEEIKDEDIEEIKRTNYIIINNNPLRCDCNMEHILPYLQNEKAPIHFINNNLSCTYPQNLQDISINLLTPDQLICPLEDYKIQCPNNCTCSWRPSDTSIIYNCSGINLNQLPILPTVDLDFLQMELHVEENDIKEIPKNKPDGYEYITKLYLSHNQITELLWIPPELEVLALDNNQLQWLSSSVLKLLNEPNVKNLSLEGNPWNCNCDSIDFADFLRNNMQKVTNAQDIRCTTNGLKLKDLYQHDLCKLQQILTYTMFTLLVILLLFAGAIAYYYRNQNTIKIWLYSKNWCLWWVTEEELDKDKIYDAFISYATKDEELVTKDIISVLENGSHPYKICWHRKNFIPGEFITSQIIKSVCESRRTIIILSKNFLESAWAKMEFHTAHTYGMDEGRIRILIILLEEIDMNLLDNEMRTYLKTNTYIKWGEPYFWNKLRYALPHHQHYSN